MTELPGGPTPEEAEWYARSGAHAERDGTLAGYLERVIFGHRAVWHRGWKLVNMHPSIAAIGKIGTIPIQRRDGDFDHDAWDLYNLDEDFSEAHDLAKAQPEKVREAARRLVGGGRQARRMAAWTAGTACSSKITS